MNNCWNYITIILNQDELITLMHHELMYSNLKNKLLFHDHIELLQQSDKGIKIKVWSQSKPNFQWLSKMINTYKSCWIKNEWYEESGLSGIWIGQILEDGPNIIKYEWNDLSVDEENIYFKMSTTP